MFEVADANRMRKIPNESSSVDGSDYALEISIAINEDRDSSNPYIARASGLANDQRRHSQEGSRFVASILLGVFGAFLGAGVYSVGYGAVAFLLESTLVPPLRSPPNYGQFGFELIEYGLFGLVCGASLAALAYVRLTFWLIPFLLLSMAMAFVSDGVIGDVLGVARVAIDLIFAGIAFCATCLFPGRKKRG